MKVLQRGLDFLLLCAFAMVLSVIAVLPAVLFLIPYFYLVIRFELRGVWLSYVPAVGTMFFYVLLHEVFNSVQEKLRKRRRRNDAKKKAEESGNRK